MSHWLRGRHALITGGSGALGRPIARALADCGAAVTLIGRERRALDAAAEFIKQTTGVGATGIECDVRDPASVAAAFDRAVAGAGPVHALINNAGVASASSFQDIAIDVWRETIDVNLTGTFLCTQRVLPAMLASGEGRIVNIASTAGVDGHARVAAYAAAKHGVVGLTRSLAAETSRTAITVNAVCPGYLDGTPMLARAIENVSRVTGKSEADARAILLRHVPGGRFAATADVAARVAWLCSAEGAGVTGQALVVDGAEGQS